MTTPLRRKLALAAGLVALAAPVLSSCGFDYATDRPNVIANGGYSLDSNGMRVLASRIVASSDGQGTFIATIALNPSENAATSTKSYAREHALTGLSVAPGSDVTVTASGSVEKTVNTSGVANLADPSVGGIPVTGTFKAGDIVPITLTFADGSSATVQTPVVPECGDYVGAGQSSPSSSPTIFPEDSPYSCSQPSSAVSE